MRRTHELKSWPKYFRATFAGIKPFELRKFDRDFRQGDLIVLKEFNPTTEEYTGRKAILEITYILSDGPWLQPGYCCMGVKDLDQPLNEVIDRETLKELGFR